MSMHNNVVLFHIWTTLLIIAHDSVISRCNHCNCAQNYGSIRTYFACFYAWICEAMGIKAKSFRS